MWGALVERIRDGRKTTKIRRTQPEIDHGMIFGNCSIFEFFDSIGQKPTCCRLIDHLIGEREEHRRHIEAGALARY
jgi:hypothetical protein